MLIWLILGVVVLGKVFWKFLNDFYVFVLVPLFGVTPDLKELFINNKEQWAVVTGASQGIGRGYSLALAAKGFHLILIGRNIERLAKVAAEIRARDQVSNEGRREGRELQVRVIQFDFDNNYDEDCFNNLKNGFENLNVVIVVNNVGIASTDEVPFGSNFDGSLKDFEYSKKLMNINIKSTLLLNSIFLPKFIESFQKNSTRSGGAIINLASAVAVSPIGGSAIYSASKAFIDFFSNALRQEIQSKSRAGSSNPPVIIQTVYPYFVKTALIPEVARIYFPNFLAPDPETFAKSALNTLSLQDKTNGTLSHGVQHLLYSSCATILPGRVFERLLKVLLWSLLWLDSVYSSRSKRSD